MPERGATGGCRADELHAAVADRAPDRCEARDGVEERRLAGAVGADQPDDLAPTHLDGDVVERDHSAVSHPHVAGLEQRAHRHPRPQRPWHVAELGGVLHRDGEVDRVRSRLGATGTAGREQAIGEPAQRAVQPADALGLGDDGEHEEGRRRDRHDAVGAQVDDRDGREELRKCLEEDCGGDDPGRRARAAHDDDGDELERLEQEEGVLRADRPRLEREDAAGQAHDRTREGVGEKLRGTGLDAEADRPGFDVADGEERATRLRDRDAAAATPAPARGTRGRTGRAARPPPGTEGRSECAAGGGDVVA